MKKALILCNGQPAQREHYFVNIERMLTTLLQLMVAAISPGNMISNPT
ncbi:MAG: hypothetical protein U5J63_06505 [Fodinibius sp.]|nr:hypothetical protein [Fodinibius sp.]